MSNTVAKNQAALQISNGRSPFDEKLLANARKSLNEIGQLTGLPGEVAAERLAILLEDKGWMSERQEERYMLIELGDLIEDSRARLKRASDEDYAGIAKIVLGAMQQMAQRWDTRKKLVEEDIEQITAANARTFSEAYEVAGYDIIDSIVSMYPDVKLDEAARYEIMRSGLVKASRVLDKKIKQ